MKTFPACKELTTKHEKLQVSLVPGMSGDKNISILHLSCRTSDLQFSQHTHLSFKSVCNKEHKGAI